MLQLPTFEIGGANVVLKALNRILFGNDIAYQVDVPSSNEPEDIDFWDRKIVMYCGQTGGLYKISPN